MVSSEIYDILTKLLKFDEENATDDSQLLWELFSGESATFTYATEKSRVIKKNTPFSIIGSTQLPMLTKIVYRLDQRHGLLDRFLIRPTPDETSRPIERLKAVPNSVSDVIYLKQCTAIFIFSYCHFQCVLLFTCQHVIDDFSKTGDWTTKKLLP